MLKYKGFFGMSLIFLIAICCCGCGNGKAGVDVSSTDVEFPSYEPETPQIEPVSVVVSESENTQEPAPAPEPEVISLTISAAGDVSLGNLQIHGYEGTFREMYDLQGPEYFLQNVKPIFEEDDMTIVNFEGVLTESTDLVEKQYNIKGEPSYIDISSMGSLEDVSLSGIHIC